MFSLCRRSDGNFASQNRTNKGQLIQPSFYPRISEYSGTSYSTSHGILPSQIQRHRGSRRRRFSSDLTILVRYELAAVANLVDYAELILRLGENRVYRITEP